MSQAPLRTGLPILAVTGGVGGFAACGLALALLGLGVPYAMGAAIAGLCAGLLLYSAGRWIEARTPADPAPDRLATLERDMSNLRHELRGALSPALMVSDRLLRNDDAMVRKAGETVVRSIDRATALIGHDRPREPSA